MSVSLIDGHIDDDVMTSEELIEELEKVRYNVTSEYHKAVIDAAIDTLKSQKAESERLTNIVDDGAEVCHNCHSKYAEKIKQAKAEAIKEFAERLKEHKIDVDVSFGYGREVYTEAVAVIEIDNLVKEMAGEG